MNGGTPVLLEPRKSLAARALSVRERFRRFASVAASAVGSPSAFVLSCLVLVTWAASGPLFHFSDTWQLIINTATTIVTFLMVFLIQNTQNRDAKAIHLKLDELIRSVKGARNRLVCLENLTDEELAELEQEFALLRERSQKKKATPKEEDMRYQIELALTEPIHTAVIRSRVRPQELPQFVPAACGEVWSFVRSAKLPQPGRHLALYLDGHGSVEVGVEVSEPFVGNDRVHCSNLPDGRVVTTVHFGPYPLLREAHAAIHRWCVEQKLQVSGVSWEIYGHWQESWNADSSKIRTDVFHLLSGEMG